MSLQGSLMRVQRQCSGGSRGRRNMPSWPKEWACVFVILPVLVEQPRWLEPRPMSSCWARLMSMSNKLPPWHNVALWLAATSQLAVITSQTWAISHVGNQLFCAGGVITTPFFCEDLLRLISILLKHYPSTNGAVQINLPCLIMHQIDSHFFFLSQFENTDWHF